LGLQADCLANQFLRFFDVPFLELQNAQVVVRVRTQRKDTDQLPVELLGLVQITFEVNLPRLQQLFMQGGKIDFLAGGDDGTPLMAGYSRWFGGNRSATL
jgi:hypothetical protein